MWKILFIIAGIVTALLMRHEIRRYTDARLAGALADFDRRRLARRMLGIGILSLLLAMTYFGYSYKEIFSGRPLFFAFYWGASLLLAFLLIVLAMVDARAVFRHTIKMYMDEGGETERLERFLAKDHEKAGRKIS
ncbi:MAG: hypothetical protein AB1489_03820 [Acidobacteriota bacterium]